MEKKDLLEKYRRTGRVGVNRAIRAEIPGGKETLDALELFHKIASRVGRYDPDGQPSIAQVAIDRLSGIADAME